jgi:NADH-quinone oxidoreductase subunit H
MGELVMAAALPPALLLVSGAVAALQAALRARAVGAPVGSALLVPLSESLRLLRQQRRTIAGADALLWRTAGFGLLVAAVLQLLVVPFGGVVVADIPVGVVWFNTVDVLMWAWWWLLGWGANSAWSLVGGHRFLAQALAYELPLMFALTAPAVAAGSLRMADVEAAQAGVWFAVQMPVAFLVYLISVTAFAAWGPFASAVGRDAAGGVLAELSGPDRLLVQVGRLALLVSGAAVAVPLFLGGGSGPLLPQWVWGALKTVLLVVTLILLGRRLPVLRPERLAEIGWLVLVPLTLLQLLVVAVLAAGRSGGM